MVKSESNFQAHIAARYGDGIARRSWQGSKVLGLPKRGGK